ncbi:MAG: hypothetical protein ACD_40C00335G0005 [uncultured bacterium]|nr:MAG: hypothetical protein ACD_40C00335G0005 [uncultured bacterium]
MSKLHYPILVVLLLAAFFVRVYRTDELLRFYYDQGRDAMIISDMIRNIKPVLVGPTTGLAGLLRGPASYYTLAPAYLIGQGSPIIAAYWLQIISIIGLYFSYLISRKLFSPSAGLITVFLLGFSAHIVDLSRWLSEPPLTLTTVPVLLYGLIQIRTHHHQIFWWLITALLLGLNLQFEIASAIWFLPPIILLALVSKNYRPSLKTILISTLIFILTLLPQIIFDLRHDGIMRQAIIANFGQTANPSFGFDIASISRRLILYQDTLAYILAPYTPGLFYLVILLFLPLLWLRSIRRHLLIPLVFFLVPLLVLTFYIGNSGNFYSYYLITVFPIFLILIAGTLHYYFQDRFLAPLAIIVLVVFGFTNLPILKNFLNTGINGPNSITIKNQLDSLDWIYNQSKGQPFNVDIYVPPVIPYSYDYLFRWYGQKKFGYQPSDDPQSLTYLLFEVDPDSERFHQWYDSFNTQPIATASSGGVTVEFRSQLSTP